MFELESEKVKKTITEYIDELLPDSSLINFVNGNSKLIRTKLAVLYLKTFNAEITDSIINVLAAGELIHNASLLHDDVIDDAKKRRGETTIGEKYSPGVSILCGDYIVSKAVEILEMLDNKEVSINFLKCVNKMAKAEIKQFFHRGKEYGIDLYLEICKGKTAELFSAILKSCAQLSGIDSSVAENFGEKFGIYFQIKNDMTASSILEDSKNGVFSAVRLLGIENSESLSDNYRQELISLLNKLPKNQFRTGLEGLIKNI